MILEKNFFKKQYPFSLLVLHSLELQAKFLQVLSNNILTWYCTFIINSILNTALFLEWTISLQISLVSNTMPYKPRLCSILKRNVADL